MELIHKYMISEEQEIIDLLISNNPNRTDWLDEGIIQKIKNTDRNLKRGTARIAGLAVCNNFAFDKMTSCKISVYQKYIGQLEHDLKSANTDKQKSDIQDKIKKAKARVATWTDTLKTHQKAGEHAMKGVAADRKSRAEMEKVLNDPKSTYKQKDSAVKNHWDNKEAKGEWKKANKTKYQAIKKSVKTNIHNPFKI